MLIYQNVLKYMNIPSNITYFKLSLIIIIKNKII